MLFLSYTGARPAEFVYLSKGKASQDSLGKAEDTNKFEILQEATEEDYNNKSNAGNNPEYNNSDCFEDNNNTADDNIDKTADCNSSYNIDKTEVTITEDTDNCYKTKTGEFGEPVQSNCDTAKLEEFGEAVQKYKAFCYKDICFWVVQNLRQEERDLLVIEVYLRNYKKVDNKPKLYIAFFFVSSLS